MIKRNTESGEWPTGKYDGGKEAGGAGEEVMTFFLKDYLEGQPEVNDFDGVFPAKEIAEDRAYVQERESDFDKPSGRMANFLESLIASSQVAEANWFGDDEYPVFIVQTTRFDDIANGADLVCEWEVDGEVVRISVDVTVSEDTDVITRKFDKIREEVRNKKLGRVKYLDSQLTEERGLATGLPHIVIGVDTKELTRIINRFTPFVQLEKQLAVFSEMEEKQRLTPAQKAEKAELEAKLQIELVKIDQDPVRFTILEQIDSQLGNQIVEVLTRFFKDYPPNTFRNKGESGRKIERVHSRLAALVDRAVNEESYVLERMELLEDLQEVISDIQKQDEARGQNIKNIFNALRLIERLRQKKQKAAGPMTSGGKVSKIQAVLTSPWI